MCVCVCATGQGYQDSNSLGKFSFVAPSAVLHIPAPPNGSPVLTDISSALPSLEESAAVLVQLVSGECSCSIPIYAAGLRYVPRPPARRHRDRCYRTAACIQALSVGTQTLPKLTFAVSVVPSGTQSQRGPQGRGPVCDRAQGRSRMGRSCRRLLQGAHPLAAAPPNTVHPCASTPLQHLTLC